MLWFNRDCDQKRKQWPKYFNTSYVMVQPELLDPK